MDSKSIVLFCALILLTLFLVGCTQGQGIGPTPVIACAIPTQVKLIGFNWDANVTQEKMWLIDTSTGATEFKGVVGDLGFYAWSATISNLQQHKMYIGGFTNNEPDLYQIFTVSNFQTTNVPLERINNIYWRITCGGKLVGFSLNFNSNPHQEELVYTDPDNGSSTVIGVFPEIDGLPVGIYPIDRTRNILYQEAHRKEDLNSDDFKMFKVQIEPFSYSTFTPDKQFQVYHVRKDGQLIGIHWNGSNEELRIINTNTGQSSLIGIIPKMKLEYPRDTWVTVMDPKGEKIYQKGVLLNDPMEIERIFVIDTYTGNATYLTTGRQFDILLFT